jgi:transcription elongation factor Elf1
MSELKKTKNPINESNNKKKFFIKPTYQRTFYCKNCNNESTFDIVKGREIIDQKDGVVYQKSYDGDINPFKCKTCGLSNYLFEIKN